MAEILRRFRRSPAASGGVCVGVLKGWAEAARSWLGALATSGRLGFRQD